jgi:hypothetical protein
VEKRWTIGRIKKKIHNLFIPAYNANMPWHVPPYRDQAPSGIKRFICGRSLSISAMWLVCAGTSTATAAGVITSADDNQDRPYQRITSNDIRGVDKHRRPYGVVIFRQRQRRYQGDRDS